MKAISKLKSVHAFASRRLTLTAFICLLMMSISAAQSTDAEMEIAVNQVEQLIQEHQEANKQVLQNREPAAYQMDALVTIKSVFLRQAKKELTIRQTIQEALDATEDYCVGVKNFPADKVTIVKNEIEQALE